MNPPTWEDLEYDIACTLNAQTKLLDRAIHQFEACEPSAYHNGAWTLLELPSLVSL